MHMWCHVTNHLIISNDKDSNSEANKNYASVTLGVIIEKGMTHMDPIKIAGIKNWPTPTKVKEVCSFLGFCNFYRPFIQGFAHLARPLNELTQKDTEWTWEA
jgi:hypothetical protein